MFLRLPYHWKCFPWMTAVCQQKRFCRLHIVWGWFPKCSMSLSTLWAIICYPIIAKVPVGAIVMEVWLKKQYTDLFDNCWSMLLFAHENRNIKPTRLWQGQHSNIICMFIHIRFRYIVIARFAGFPRYSVKCNSCYFVHYVWFSMAN